MWDTYYILNIHFFKVHIMESIMHTYQDFQWCRQSGRVPFLSVLTVLRTVTRPRPPSTTPRHSTPLLLRHTITIYITTIDIRSTLCTLIHLVLYPDWDSSSAFRRGVVSAYLTPRSQSALTLHTCRNTCFVPSGGVEDTSLNDEVLGACHLSIKTGWHSFLYIHSSQRVGNTLFSACTLFIYVS